MQARNIVWDFVLLAEQGDIFVAPAGEPHCMSYWPQEAGPLLMCKGLQKQEVAMAVSAPLQLCMHIITQVTQRLKDLEFPTEKTIHSIFES